MLLFELEVRDNQSEHSNGLSESALAVVERVLVLPNVRSSNPITRSRLRPFVASIRFGTGISFPISLSDLPKNTIATIRLIWKLATSQEVSEFNKYRNAHGLLGGSPIRSAPTRAVHVVCPGVREIDFPLVMPDFLGLYGPIVLDTAPIETADPELNRWLGRGETMVMYMGAHFYYTESRVKAVINGFLGGINYDSNT